MKLKIQYHKHSRRRQRAMDLWLKMATDYNGGMSAADIARRYTNPQTGKPYTREHIYLVLKKLQTVPLARYIREPRRKRN